MSSDKINQLFWLTYCQAIKEIAGANFGPSGAFFLCSEAQEGPPAGNAIPNEYTNQGLYDIGNNLLAADNLFYNPSALHGYVEALSTYLDWVDLGAHPSEALDTALLEALRNQAAAGHAFRTQLTRALKLFGEESKDGLVPQGQSFAGWIAAGNAPSFDTASAARRAAAATVNTIQDKIAGPLAGQLTRDRKKLSDGMNSQIDLPGFNMRCAIGNFISPEELVRMRENGETVPAPPYQLLPLYQSPEYKQAVQAMERKIGTSYNPANSVSFTIDTRKNTSDFNFGQTTASTSIGVSWDGWFSFSAGGNISESKRVITSASESENVKVKITYDTIKVIPIEPGSWNIDVSQYRLRSDAPKEVKTLVRVSSLVFAAGLGYEITVGTSVASQIDTYYRETVSTGGSISIFGIPIGIGGSGGSSTTSASHTAIWEKESKTFKVVPTEEAGYATIVGLMGEKFKIL